MNDDESWVVGWNISEIRKVAIGWEIMSQDEAQIIPKHLKSSPLYCCFRAWHLAVQTGFKIFKNVPCLWHSFAGGVWRMTAAAELQSGFGFHHILMFKTCSWCEDGILQWAMLELWGQGISTWMANGRCPAGCSFWDVFWAYLIWITNL